MGESVLTVSYEYSTTFPAQCGGSIVKFSAIATNVCFPDGDGSREFSCETNIPYYFEYGNASCPAYQESGILELMTSCSNASSLNLTSGATVDGYYAQTRCYPAQPSNSSTIQPTSSPTYGPSYVYINYYVDETCYGEVMFQQGYLTNYCFPDGDKNSYELSCSPEGVLASVYNTTDCSGTSTIDSVTTLTCNRNTAIQCRVGTNIEDIILMDSGSTNINTLIILITVH